MEIVAPGGEQGDREGVARDFDADLVEYVVIAFPDLTSVAGIASALGHLVTTGRIRILDLVLIRKDEEGQAEALQPDAAPELAPLDEVEGEVGGLLGQDDVALAADALPASSIALVLVIEDTWAEVLASAVRLSHGRIVGGERIARRRLQGLRRGATTEESA